MVHNLGKNRGLDLPHLGCAVLFTKALIESAKTFSKCRVKMVFEVIVSSES